MRNTMHEIHHVAGMAWLYYLKPDGTIRHIYRHIRRSLHLHFAASSTDKNYTGKKSRKYFVPHVIYPAYWCGYLDMVWFNQKRPAYYDNKQRITFNKRAGNLFYDPL
jgi:hypothetical protein